MFLSTGSEKPLSGPFQVQLTSSQGRRPCGHPGAGSAGLLQDHDVQLDPACVGLSWAWSGRSLEPKSQIWKAFGFPDASSRLMDKDDEK